MRNTLTALVLLWSLAACGGATTEGPPAEPAPEPAPTVVEQPVAPAPAPNPHEGTLWYVYWEGIHCLTVYPQAGLIRSEEPDSANATFSSRSEHFSIISTYFEHEDAWVPAIEAATDVDDLIRRFAAMEDVEIEEARNPTQDSAF